MEVNKKVEEFAAVVAPLMKIMKEVLGDKVVGPVDVCAVQQQKELDLKVARKQALVIMYLVEPLCVYRV